MQLKYFTLKEFESPDKPGSGTNMDSELLTMLDDLRERYGKPIRITSGFRSEQHNAAVGGVRNSSHLRGYAVDIAAGTSGEKYEILKCAIEAGFNRIGIARTFIHVDNDPEKASRVVWTY